MLSAILPYRFDSFVTGSKHKVPAAIWMAKMKTLAKTLLLALMALCAGACAGSAGSAAANTTVPDVASVPQQRDAWFVIATADGVLVAINEGKVHATFRLRGTVGVREGRANIFLLDDQIVQLAVASPEEWRASSASKSPLEAHMEWESAYFSSNLGTRLVPRRLASCSAPETQAFMAWALDIPPLDAPQAENPTRVYIFVTTIVNGQVVVVSSPISAAEREDVALARLLHVLGSLDVRSTRISPEVESRRVRAEAP